MSCCICKKNDETILISSVEYLMRTNLPDVVTAVFGTKLVPENWNDGSHLICRSCNRRCEQYVQKKYMSPKLTSTNTRKRVLQAVSKDVLYPYKRLKFLKNTAGGGVGEDMDKIEDPKEFRILGLMVKNAEQVYLDGAILVHIPLGVEVPSNVKFLIEDDYIVGHDRKGYIVPLVKLEPRTKLKPINYNTENAKALLIYNFDMTEYIQEKEDIKHLNWMINEVDRMEKWKDVILDHAYD